MTSIPGKVGIIVLAAGRSRRFDGDKRRAKFRNGLSLLQATLASIPDSFTNRLLVLGPGDELLGDGLSGWQVVIAPDAGTGMGRSLATGIGHAIHWDAALIVLGDMPLVSARTFGLVGSALQHTAIVVPVFRDLRGHPVGFRQELFPELLTLGGDEGARSVIANHPQDVMLLDCDDPGILSDIDTTADLEKARLD